MLFGKKSGPQPGEVWHFREGMPIRIANVRGKGSSAIVRGEVMPADGPWDGPSKALVSCYASDLGERIHPEI